MKKKLCFFIIIFLFLFTPIPSGTYKDGGTREYTALTYKVVKWHRFTDSGEIYAKTKIYFFPKNFKSIDGLWDEIKLEK